MFHTPHANPERRRLTLCWCPSEGGCDSPYGGYAAAVAAHLQLSLQGLRAVSAVGSYPAIVLIQSRRDLGEHLAIVGRGRRGLVVTHQFMLAAHHHMIFIAIVVHPCCFVQVASTSFCANLPGGSFQASGTLPCSSIACSSRMLRWRGTSTIVDPAI